MKKILLKLFLFVFSVTILLLVFNLYTSSEFMITIANQIWLCN